MHAAVRHHNRASHNAKGSLGLYEQSKSTVECWVMTLLGVMQRGEGKGWLRRRCWMRLPSHQRQIHFRRHSARCGRMPASCGLFWSGEALDLGTLMLAAQVPARRMCS